MIPRGAQRQRWPLWIRCFNDDLVISYRGSMTRWVQPLKLTALSTTTRGRLLSINVLDPGRFSMEGPRGGARGDRASLAAPGETTHYPSVRCYSLEEQDEMRTRGWDKGESQDRRHVGHFTQGPLPLSLPRSGAREVFRIPQLRCVQTGAHFRRPGLVFRRPELKGWIIHFHSCSCSQPVLSFFLPEVTSIHRVPPRNHQS